jgi:DinB superfamily
MNPKLARSLRKLNEQTEHLIAELQSWFPERLCFRPSGEAWSALDLLDHLRLTEGAVLATMRRNLMAGNRVTVRDRFRSARILGIMLLPTRLKAPGAVKSILPAGTVKDLSALRQEWVGDRNTLAGFLGSLSSSDQKQGVFRHPFGGWTTANGALLFLRSHLHHHRYQLYQLRSGSKGMVGR